MSPAFFSVLVASAAAAAPVNVPIAKPYLQNLSEYHLFVGNPYDHVPNEGVLPYDLNTPLFSDYTTKHRFIWVPEGTPAEYKEDDVFNFPVGTVIVKTFGYLHDIRDPEQGEEKIETRLLIHQKDGWVGLPYVWNADKSDAVLKITGGTRDISWTHYDGSKRSNNYIIPNLNDCKACHKIGEVMQPIGPKARNLNKLYPYADGVKNQLVRWAEAGDLEGAPDDPDDAPRVAVWNDPASGTLDERARAWLDVNCMHCHNPQGPANTTGLDLTYTQIDKTKLGVMKPPVAAGRGAGDRRFDIVPGHPEESIFMFRLESTEPGVMMPELPRRLVDEEGVALIREWIASMPSRKQTD